MSTELMDQQYKTTRLVYGCFALGPITLGLSHVLGIMAGNTAKPVLCQRFINHLNYLHQSLLITLALVIFVVGGWLLMSQASGFTGLGAGIAGSMIFYYVRIIIGWRALKHMHTIDFPEEYAPPASS